MKHKILFLLIALSLVVVGCSSKIVYGPSGVMTASNYTITEALDQTGKVVTRTYIPFIPDRWYSDWLDKLGPLLAFINQLKGGVK